MIPSLLQIPSAVSDSKLHSVLPNNGKGDFQFDRSTGATRINKDGLIEEVGYFSSELVQNGNFSELGSELVTNGDFASNSDWTLTGATINAGKVNVNSTSPIYIIQNSVATIGKTYRVELTVSDYVSGDLRLRYPFTKSESEFTGNGTYVFYGVAVDARVELQGRFSGQTYDYKIDNVSVKQVDPNDRWTLGTDVEYGNSFIKMNNSAALAGAQQTNVITSGVQCKVTFTVQNYVSGTVNLRHPLSQNVTANGTYVFEGAANDTKVLIRGNAVTNNFEVTNISVVEVQGDRPRLSYDITNGVVEDKPHLLLEPSSTNLLTFSEDFSGYTTQGNISILSNNNTSPSNTSNASLISITDTNVNTKIQKNISVTSGNTYTFSVFLKSDSNLTVEIGGIASAHIPVNTTNNWQRFSVTQVASSNSRFPQVKSNGTQGTFYMWGAMLEEQSYATSYIPTAGTTITRAAETCNNSKPSVNSTEGVLYAEVALNGLTPNSYIQISDNSYNNRVAFINNNSATSWRTFYRVGGASQIDSTATGLDVFEINKIALSWKVNSFKFYVNGTKIIEDTSGSVNAANTFTRIDFSDINNTNNFYGKVKGLAVYNEALTDAQLIELTT